MVNMEGWIILRGWETGIICQSPTVSHSRTMKITLLTNFNREKSFWGKADA